ncbi:MAG: UvrD-helicase domain-containing protein [Verrucomicrobia bacterium]|nr:UvrD-helicase domain-containing protein [Verrucomicrobiota bacterium]
MILNHEMIRASAGSGKTHQLALRYIRLLALGANPESIIALTFTRKAAGEFFSRIAETLADSARSTQLAHKLHPQLNISQWNPDQALHLLKSFLWSSPKIQLGTLDQFFFKILSQYSFEFGLPTGFVVADPMELERENNRILTQILQPRTSREFVSHLMETLKEASHGMESATVTSQLKRFISEFHHLFLTCPHKYQWGDPNTIWSQFENPSRLLPDSANDWTELLAYLTSQNLSGSKIERWLDLQKVVQNFSPLTKMESSLETLLKNTASMLTDYRNGRNPELTFFRPPAIPFPDRGKIQLLLNALNPVIAKSWQVKLRRTQGLYQLLSDFESRYDSYIRRRGVLTFADLLHLLNPSSSSRLLSQKPSDERRFNIDFRLDARFDHWLLDEFQDTSRIQWSILENLLDEVFQDTSGARSVFIVGDIKQSIYGWRGGDHRLFEFIESRYTAHAQSPLVCSSLDFSWRSGPEIVRFINLIFHPDNWAARMREPDILSQWMWKDHITARPDQPGHIAVLTPASADSLSHNSESISLEKLGITINIVKQINPMGRGLSCAVLVRSNQEAHNVALALRAAGIPAALAADIPIASDNLIVPAILSMIQFLIHPLDTFAYNHFLMTPLAALFKSERLSPDDFHAIQLSRLLRLGISNWIDDLLSKISSSPHQLDPFHSRRAHQLLGAAQQFEELHNSGLDAFIEYIQSYTIQEQGNISEIQVITIHKAKGLGFDMVVLPQLNIALNKSVSPSLLTHQSPDTGNIEWVTNYPSKSITMLDPVASHVLAKSQSQSTFQELCLFYVACTRAKSYLYLIVDSSPASTTSSLIKIQDHIHSALTKANRTQSINSTQTPKMDLDLENTVIIYEDGSLEGLPQIQEMAPMNPVFPRTENSTSPMELPLIGSGDPGELSVRLIKKHPSLLEFQGNRSVKARSLFSRTNSHARRRGQYIHSLLQAIDWIDESHDWEDELRQIWTSLKDPFLSDMASIQDDVIHSLRDPSRRQHFICPDDGAGNVTLWKEKAFEMVLAHEWVSGIIDRVTLIRDPRTQQIEKAVIIDFKSDQSLNPTRYQSQLSIYCLAVARILSLPDGCVHGQLVNVI